MPTLADYWRIKQRRMAERTAGPTFDEYDGPSNPFDRDDPRTGSA